MLPKLGFRSYGGEKTVRRPTEVEEDTWQMLVRRSEWIEAAAERSLFWKILLPVPWLLDAAAILAIDQERVDRRASLEKVLEELEGMLQNQAHLSSVISSHRSTIIQLSGSIERQQILFQKDVEVLGQWILAGKGVPPTDEVRAVLAKYGVE